MATKEQTQPATQPEQAQQMVGMDQVKALLEQQRAEMEANFANQLAQAQASGGKRNTKRIVKRTEKGGLFATDPNFVCFSQRTKKNYTGNLNADWGVAVALFGGVDPVALAKCLGDEDHILVEIAKTVNAPQEKTPAAK